MYPKENGTLNLMLAYFYLFSFTTLQKTGSYELFIPIIHFFVDCEYNSTIWKMTDEWY